MKYLLIIWLSISVFKVLPAQELPPVIEQKLELTVEADEMESEDDSYLQHLEYWKLNPLDLNSATETDLQQLRLLTPLQVSFLLQYRNTVGKLVSIYELQAVPGWDIYTIKKLLPFITVINTGKSFEPLAARLKGGDHYILARLTQVLEKAEGFKKSTGSNYEGSRPHLMMRYRYRYKNNLQYGIVADKDAGEAFFSRSQKQGFDFYSAHFFATGLGKIKTLALGDFTVNFGQGLIHWQSLAFKKSADVINIKRQSAVLRPYASAGEYYFNRGAGISLQHHHIESSVFISYRNQTASFTFDSLADQNIITSVATSGYHRTATELKNKNQLGQFSYGGAIMYKKANWHAGVNAVRYAFDNPVQKRDEPYNRFALAGSTWSNYSLDYSFTRRNMHVFGEAAIDHQFHKAFLNGMLISVDPRVDFSLLHRFISKEYQSVNGNAFTENSLPVNEQGLYAGIAMRLTPVLKLDLYADLFTFPWLRYLVDAPSKGKEYLVQFTITPSRNLEIYSRFRTEAKKSNQSNNITVTNILIDVNRYQWRLHTVYRINKDVVLRQRTELSWYQKGIKKEEGFLVYIDGVYKPLMKRIGGSIRLQYFETGSYDSRIYAYENDVLYNFSIPAFFGYGYRYYVNVDFDIRKNLTVYVKLSQTNFPNQQSIGTGNDRIKGSKKTEIKFQGVVRF